MVNVYTYSEARQNLASVLDKTLKDGEVLIKRRDGRIFVVRPQQRTRSLLDVEWIDLGLAAAEIVEFVREGRRSYDADEQADDRA